jgi:ATP synthase F1 complex assembly factor 1
MILLQFQGHQVYFTPLIEYQTKRESARPCFVVTFYTELAATKDVVLMLGEIADDNGTYSLKEAQNLVYQMQIFYVTGGDKSKRLVEKFWADPANFNYEELIETLPQKMSL